MMVPQKVKQQIVTAKPPVNSLYIAQPFGWEQQDELQRNNGFST